MATFLFKSEPGTYSFADLQRDKKATWDGITNAQALIHLRSCAKGDQVFIYHTGDEKQIVGLAEVTRGAYPDPKQDDAKLAVVDLKPLQAAAKPLTLAAIKSDPRFKDFALVKNSRLSVMPVPKDLDAIIRKLTGL